MNFSRANLPGKMSGVDGPSSLPFFQSWITLIVDLVKSESPREVKAGVLSHIERCAGSSRVLCPEFDSGLEWFNTSRPLTLSEDLRGKVVVLNFVTYCSVSCQHVFSDLKELEQVYSVEDGLVIIDVHSPKFDREVHSCNVRNAIVQHGITHPVVSDPDGRLSQALSIGCWPTTLTLGPEGQATFVLLGDGHRTYLLLGVRDCLEYYKARGEISSHSLPVRVEKHPDPASFLSYPGKVCTSPDGTILAISDSGHNRIILSTTSGEIRDIIGCGRKGFRDGDYSTAAFSCPQGLCWSRDHALYIADSENHAIRKVDLSRRLVQTLAGNGEHGADEEGGSLGLCQTLNTPWDVCLVNSQSCSSDTQDSLLIAMAGANQIWLLTLSDGACWYNSERIAPRGICVRAYGSGKGEHRNSLNAVKAGFAQPTGLAYSPDTMQVFVADSLSSAIRTIALDKGSVRNVVGASRDPKDLHTHGDVDGTGLEVRLQHPLGVAYSRRLAKVLVADTFNHKIKVIDPVCHSSHVLIGDGQANADGPKITWLSEPGGICLAETESSSILYIADTNNHCIKVVDLSTNVSRKMVFRERPQVSPAKRYRLSDDEGITNPPIVVNVSRLYYVLDEPIFLDFEVLGLKCCETAVKPKWNLTVCTDRVLEHTEIIDENGNLIKGTSGTVSCAEKRDFLQLRFKSSLPEDRYDFLLTFHVAVIFADPTSQASVPRLIRFRLACRLLSTQSADKVPTHRSKLSYVVAA